MAFCSTLYFLGRCAIVNRFAAEQDVLPANCARKRLAGVAKDLLTHITLEGTIFCIARNRAVASRTSVSSKNRLPGVNR